MDIQAESEAGNNFRGSVGKHPQRTSPIVNVLLATVGNLSSPSLGHLLKGLGNTELDLQYAVSSKH